MNDSSGNHCWICCARPVARDLAINQERATADAHGGAFASSLCTHCDGILTAPYDHAWAALSKYLHAHWKDIVKRGSFDLSRAFGSDASAGAINAHLYFVKLLGSKLLTAKINVELTSFSTALLRGLPHSEITLLIANAANEGGKLLYYESEVSVLRRDDEVYSAVWMKLAFPIAVKVCYLNRSAPVDEPEGFPWHPTRQRKIVKLSPYKGDTRPVHARRDLRM